MNLTAESWILGNRLKRLRKTADRTAASIATELLNGSSESRLYAIEGGYRTVGQAELAGLVLLAYNRPDLVEEMEALRAEIEENKGSSTGSKNISSAPAYDTGASLYVELEARAASVTDIHIDIIPGYFQTEEYSLIQHQMAGNNAEAARRHTAIRMERQRRIAAGSPTVHSLITEGALDRAKEVAGQLDVLYEWAQMPSIEIRILPNSFGPHIVLASFVVLRFGMEDLSDVLHTDTLTGSSMIDDDDQVAKSLQHRAMLVESALDRTESLAMIRAKALE